MRRFAPAVCRRTALPPNHHRTREGDGRDHPPEAGEERDAGAGGVQEAAGALAQRRPHAHAQQDAEEEREAGGDVDKVADTAGDVVEVAVAVGLGQLGAGHRGGHDGKDDLGGGGGGGGAPPPDCGHTTARAHAQAERVAGPRRRCSRRRCCSILASTHLKSHQGRQDLNGGPHRSRSEELGGGNVQLELQGLPAASLGRLHNGNKSGSLDNGPCSSSTHRVPAKNVQQF